MVVSALRSECLQEGRGSRESSRGGRKGTQCVGKMGSRELGQSFGSGIQVVEA